MHHQFTYIVEPPEEDDPWYLAFCPEIPEANGQGKTEQEAIDSLRGSIELILQHRREEGLRGVPASAKRGMVEFG
jgi:predicted RNase H-like HicB family nuclease